MTTTQNLHLPQWEKTDRIMMDDFNEAMAAIDAGVKAATDAAADVPRIIFGSYLGNSTESQTISLPFTPKLLYVCPQCRPTAEHKSSTIDDTYIVWGGFAAPGHPLYQDSKTSASHSPCETKIAMEIIENGFVVYFDTSVSFGSAHFYSYLNNASSKFYYFAIG